MFRIIEAAVRLSGTMNCVAFFLFAEHEIRSQIAQQIYRKLFLADLSPILISDDVFDTPTAQREATRIQTVVQKGHNLLKDLDRQIKKDLG